MSERWQQIKSIVQSALALDNPTERDQYVKNSCGGDTLLLEEVQSLLVGDEQAEEAGFLPQQSVDSMIGKTLGVYRLDRLLAEGGMGVVYTANRTDYAQRVAIKLIRQGMVTPSVIHRFETERQILASVRHPNVTQLYDGGTTPEGLPYIVMEFVEGVPIDAYCDNNRLSVPQRVALFIQVCNAVQFAHQNLIIHRDLKPSNILVTPQGTPKLMDFGIAKLLTHEMAPGPDVTQTVSRFMTPIYASPEQHRYEPLTTASDVYSLGAILYRLVAGRGHVPRGDYAAVQKQILAGQWTRPSRAATSPGEEKDDGVEENCRKRDVANPSRLSRMLSGDLDKIIMTAMSPEPNRRYSSSASLAEDLERYLAGRPVRAQKGSFWYHTTRFLKRNKGILATATMIAIVVAAGFWQYSNVEQQQKKKEAEQLTERISRTTSDLQMSKYLIHQGDFDTALDVLSNVEVVKNAPPSIIGLNEEVQQLKERLTKLNRFYEYLHKAELYGVMEYPQEASESSQAALAVFDVLSNDQWNELLPDQDLLAEQKAQLREDIHRQLILHALFIVKDGLISFGSPENRRKYEQALEVIRVAHTFRPSHSSEILQFFCRTGLGLRPKIDQAYSTPSTATDFYFSGMLHTVYYMLKNDPITQWITLMSPQLSAGGIDVITPLETSINSLTVTCTLRPNHYWAHYWLGIAQREANNYAAAENAFSACIGLDPTLAIGFLERGESTLLSPEQFPPEQTFDRSYRALADFQQALQLNLNDPYVFWKIANSFSLIFSFDICSDLSIHVLQVERPNVAGYWGRHHSNTLSTATNILSKLGEGSSDARCLGGAALAQLQLGRKEDALNTATAALEIAPDEPLALLVRAIANIKSETNLDEAIEALHSLESNSPLQSLAQMGLAEAYELKSDPETASKHWQTSYLVASVPASRRYIRKQLERLNSPIPDTSSSQGSLSLEDILRIGPNERSNPLSHTPGIQAAFTSNHLGLNRKFLSVAYLRMAQAFIREEQHEEALVALRRALSLNPDNPVYIANQAHAHLIAGDLERAQRDIIESIDLLSTWMNSHHLYGHILLAQGEKEKARERFEYNSLGLYDKEHIGCLATLYQESGEHSRAVEHLNGAIRMFPRHAPLYRQRARSYGAMNETEKQDKDLQKADRLESRR